MGQFHHMDLFKRNIFVYLVVILFIFSFGKSTEAGNNISSPLVVFGGEPEGIMAAVSAARTGTETILVLQRKNPGGLITYGGLNYLDLNYGSNGKIINESLFQEWHNMVGGSISFSVEKAEKSFENLLAAEKRIKIIRDADILQVNLQKKVINSIVIRRDGEEIIIKADRFIDASQNADLAYKSSAPFFKAGTDRGLPERNMAGTLILHLDDVKWNDLAYDVRKNRYGRSFINRDHAWGFAELGKRYQPVDPNIKLRGLNIVFAENDEVYINGMLIFDLAPTEKESLSRAYKRGKRELEHILKFLKENLAGFQNAELIDFPKELYIRESRHLVAEKQLTVKDQFNNKIFKNTVAYGSYPLDYQASTPEYNGFVLFNPDIYGIPFGSLIPRNYKNLLVVGRSSGYSSLAAASARVIPTGMALGEAAGRAAALSLENNINFYQLSQNKLFIAEIQKNIFGRDIKESKDSIVDDEILKPHLEFMLSWGMAIGGYNNDFQLEEFITEREFAHLIIKGLQRRKSPILYEWVPGSLETLSRKNKLTRDKAAELLLAATSHRISEIDKDKYFNKASTENLLADYIEKNIKINRLIDHREAYIIVSYFLQKYPLPDGLREIRGEYGV